MPCFPNSLLDVGSNASFARSSSAESNRNGHSALLRILNNDSVDALRESRASRQPSASAFYVGPCKAQRLI
jgi:hypothetical protein